MIILDVKFNHIYGFDDFHINFTYPKKIVGSIIEDVYLEGRPRFRYKKAVVLMGSNATGKTSLGKALLRIFKSVKESNEAILRELADSDSKAEFPSPDCRASCRSHRLQSPFSPSTHSSGA